MKLGLPSPEDFFLNESLYNELLVAENGVYDIADIIYYQGNFDVYCPGCEKSATFHSLQKSVPAHFNKSMRRLFSESFFSEYPTIERGTHHVVFQCTRNEEHLLDFIIYINRELKTINNSSLIFYSIQKIGQIPSYADLNIPHVEHFAPVLSKQDRHEFRKAVGLAAHGVGVGSYVYLRRIFENLIDKAREEAIEQKYWSDELQSEYESSRVRERIQLLKHVLPDFVVEHPEMYTLLSKGIHQLTEDECLKHFDALKMAIEIILEQKLEAKQKEKRIASARKAISIAHVEVKDGGS